MNFWFFFFFNKFPACWWTAFWKSLQNNAEVLGSAALQIWKTLKSIGATPTVSNCKLQSSSSRISETAAPNVQV